jgi:hypothetical protein
MQRQNASPYPPLIAAATGAPTSKLAILENIMRDEIFHSTLDWQTADQLAAAARQAHDIYRSSPCFYDMGAIHQKAAYNLSKLEARLAKVRSTGDAVKIQDLETRISLARRFEQSAREALPRLADFYEPDPA